jgi:hypothetical protein
MGWISWILDTGKIKNQESREAAKPQTPNNKRQTTNTHSGIGVGFFCTPLRNGLDRLDKLDTRYWMLVKSRIKNQESREAVKSQTDQTLF